MTSATERKAHEVQAGRVTCRFIRVLLYIWLPDPDFKLESIPIFQPPRRAYNEYNYGPTSYREGDARSKIHRFIHRGATS